MIFNLSLNRKLKDTRAERGHLRARVLLLFKRIG